MWRERRTTYNACRIRIVQTHADALDGCVGVEWQPSSTRLGNTGLHHQQINTARQPQSDDMAGTHTCLNQPGSDQIRAFVQRLIGQFPITENQSDMMRNPGRARLKNIGENFIADQFDLDRPMQDVRMNRNARMACGWQRR